ncbi:MAG TPA: transglycosylase domain-containing protein [Candidatus Dormibacteraeota bacterium]|nr:transglycosylase domain-containing protein [Candidatus Dormibacteraeota bacterium]
MVAVAAVVIFAVGSSLWASAKLSNLPNPGAAPVLARSVVFYDARGNVLAERNPQGQFHVVQRLGEMGKWAPLATVGAEDRSFYQHGALDPVGVARAIVVDTLARKPLQGGSTISQQLVKITVLQSDKTFSRKLKEAIIANQMEHRYSKDQILEMYLNRLYYGHGAYGIGSATKTYFGRDKETKDLTVGQAAFLAGMIQAPSGNDPQVHYSRARGRELYVLSEMVKAGFIKQSESNAAAGEDIQKELVYDTSYRESKAPHFINYVISKLEAQFGADAMQQGGLSIYTTLNPDLQALAEQSVARGVKAMGSMGVNNGDLLAARPATGEILAWVGSTDYTNQNIGGQFDVIRSPRQPGSSFKPYAYEAALKDRKITLNTCLQDAPTNFNGYRPLDFDNSYMGPMTARDALVLSRNVPAVAVAQKEGMGNVINLADAMGIRSALPPYLSTSIGAGEITMLDHLQGYQVFANEGRKMPLVSITKVTDAGGGVLYQSTPGQQANQQQVLTPAEAYLMTDTLKAYQTQWNLGWQRQMAGKSGTTGGSTTGVHSDAWMMAYNHDVVVGAWAGNTGADGRSSTISAFGVNTGETTLGSFINGLPADMNHWYQKPGELVQKGGEIYLPGTENQQNSCSQAAPRGDGGGSGGDKKKKKDGNNAPPPPPPGGGSGGGGD